MHVYKFGWLVNADSRLRTEINSYCASWTRKSLNAVKYFPLVLIYHIQPMRCRKTGLRPHSLIKIKRPAMQHSTDNIVWFKIHPQRISRCKTWEKNNGKHLRMFCPLKNGLSEKHDLVAVQIFSWIWNELFMVGDTVRLVLQTLALQFHISNKSWFQHGS